MPLDRLPDLPLKLILDNLSPEDIIPVRQSCTTLRDFCPMTTAFKRRLGTCRLCLQIIRWEHGDVPLLKYIYNLFCCRRIDDHRVESVYKYYHITEFIQHIALFIPTENDLSCSIALLSGFMPY